MKISMIACVTTDMCIGFSNKLLISLKPDMNHFKMMTMSRVVVMGSNTYRSLPDMKPLPGRTNVIISRKMAEAPEGFEVYHSVEEFMEAYRDRDDEIFIIGGAGVYDAFMPYAGKIYLTHVHLDSVSLIQRMYGEYGSGSLITGTMFPKSVYKYQWDLQKSVDEVCLCEEYGIVRYNFLTLVKK